MRVWTREPYGTSCGLCDQRIEKGQPVMLITGEWSKAKPRCPTCAGEPVPELPELVIPDRVKIMPTRKAPRNDWRGMRALVDDYKNKQAGDR